MTPLRRVPLSVLDVAPVGDGQTTAQALRATLELAREVDALGFTRFWLAEHHGMTGIASSAPSVLVGAVAATTSSIRVGSGGVMLPNHAPLIVAEQFGTLAALHPGRIDLGLGRAPGTDQITASALRRSAKALSADDFPQQLGELIGFLQDRFVDQGIRAVPLADTPPPIWLLGSSGYSAQLAGILGLPFAFAHHFSPANTVPALQLYRDSFRSSPALDRPYSMIAAQVVCAESDAAAQRLALPSALSFLRLRQGRPGRLPTPQQAADYAWTGYEREIAAGRLAEQAVGGPDTVRERLADLLAETGADELMATAMVHDPGDRITSMRLLHGLVAGDGELPQGLGAGPAQLAVGSAAAVSGTAPAR